ncbi:MAG: hypothetical protein DME74_10745 [Verrucomicrobia bacterium]|nr:MAG: hypothetical protein DME74_10745 [Verrucomicrobiota bacterium]
MIAISYRREDSLPVAGRLYDRLERQFGKKHVFMDFDSIRPGFDFRDQIKDTIEQTKVLIAVIGPHWLGEQKDGSRRIDDSTDFVRLEVALALQRGIPVIPVLINNAPMPKLETLPHDIQALAFRQALPLDSGLDFRQHVDRLISSISDAARSPAGQPVSAGLRKSKIQLAWIALAFGLLIGAALAVTMIASKNRLQIVQKSELKSQGNKAKELPAIAQITASSELKPQIYRGEWKSYAPRLAFDGDKNTAWCGTSGGVREWIMARFNSPFTLRGMSIYNGYVIDVGRYYTNNRVRTLRVTFSNGTGETLQLGDKMELQHFEFQRPVSTEWARFEILDVYRGTKYDATPISEIQFDYGVENITPTTGKADR